MASDLVHDLRGLLQRGTRGQRHLGVHNALILIGEIGGGHSSEEEYQGDYQHQVNTQVGEFPGKDTADCPLVLVPGLIEHPVEPPEERPEQEKTGFGGLMPFGYRLEERCAQDRGKDQSHHHGKQHGGDDGHGELPVDDTGRPGKKGHGAEHRRKHQAYPYKTRW